MPIGHGTNGRGSASECAPTCAAPTIDGEAMKAPTLRISSISSQMTSTSHWIWRAREFFLFSRYNHWHGSPWHYVVDGTDHIVQESSTKDPLHPVPDSTFLPLAPFPSPLNETWATTRGADLVWSPVSFERSFQMAYTRTHYGTGYYIYDQFVPGNPVIAPHPKLERERRSRSGCARSDREIGHGHRSPDRRQGGQRKGERSRIRRCHRGGFEGQGDDSCPELFHPSRSGGCLQERSSAGHLGRKTATLHRRSHRSFLWSRHSLQPRQPRVSGQGLSVQHSLYPGSNPPGVLFPHAVLSLRAHTARGRPVSRSMASNGKCGPCLCRSPRISWLIFMRPTATFPPHARRRPGAPRHRATWRERSEWSGSFVGTSFIFSHHADLQNP